MEEKTKVVSLRLSAGDYRRLHAYGVSKGLSDSAAADGLALYSTELGTYLDLYRLFGHAF